MDTVDAQLRLAAQASLALAAANCEELVAVERVSGSGRLWRLSFWARRVVAVGDFTTLSRLDTATFLSGLANGNPGLVLTFTAMSDAGVRTVTVPVDGYRPD